MEVLQNMTLTTTQKPITKTADNIEVLKSKNWLSKKEFLQLYPFSLPALNRYLSSGLLHYTKIGRRVLIKNEIPEINMEAR